MPALRTTELIDVPARTVAGALIEVISKRAHLVSVSAGQIAAVLPGQPFRGARLTGTCASTPAGTMLTCELSWLSPNAFVDGIAVRRPVLSLLGSVAQGTRTRAVELVDAPVIVGTAIVRDGRLLAQQRAFPEDVAGMWELPGGRVEPGESDQAAVIRECQEELGITVSPGVAIGPDVVLPGGKLLRIYEAESAGDPVAVEHEAVRWLSQDELGDVEWLPADRILLPVFRDLVSGYAR
ncbi:(deoxy)nucleoside triphosphate pyrophosphohydrolase [Kibdelosporangium philippinense]|uniref:8-oxo-dGTP diphosphatase n=1 Tax=Kibdelosporangium philippinense TaxID=211113 RepID=A0ABS8ZPF9_9PSEU|nr:(deoxy)nucleoside triphosphate pyrophosphohydrolase [Kibdelosporangium philippinense]MCE7008516.1 (deoxy)nucleoside triphosphate pyrophosphohydrolase [Kibdelosporangium philippinense]